MAENALFFYGLLVTFVIGCMNRNKKTGRAHVPQLIIAGWTLFTVSLAAATYLSLTALSSALQA